MTVNATALSIVPSLNGVSLLVAKGGQLVAKGGPSGQSSSALCSDTLPLFSQPLGAALVLGMNALAIVGQFVLVKFFEHEPGETFITMSFALGQMGIIALDPSVWNFSVLRKKIASRSQFLYVLGGWNVWVVNFGFTLALIAMPIGVVCMWQALVFPLAMAVNYSLNLKCWYTFWQYGCAIVILVGALVAALPSFMDAVNPIPPSGYVGLAMIIFGLVNAGVVQLYLGCSEFAQAPEEKTSRMCYKCSDSVDPNVYSVMCGVYFVVWGFLGMAIANYAQWEDSMRDAKMMTGMDWVIWIAFAGTQLLYTFSYSHGAFCFGSALMEIVNMVNPTWAWALGIILFKEKFSVQELVGQIISIVGGLFFAQDSTR